MKRRARRSVIRRAFAIDGRRDDDDGRRTTDDERRTRDERAARERNYAHAFERAWGAGYARARSIREACRREGGDEGGRDERAAENGTRGARGDVVERW